MRRCKGCQRPLPDDSAPQRRYCDHPDCKRERDAYRKAHERARAYNALTRVIAPLDEQPPKRKTSSTHDAEGAHEDDRDFDPGKVTSRWDEISKAWQRPRFRDVDRLMGEAERGVRDLHRSAATPVGQLRESHGWSREDARSPGELWLKGEGEAAIAKAEEMRDRKLRWCESRPNGYLEGGALWDGLGCGQTNKSPAAERVNVQELSEPELTREQQRLGALMQEKPHE
jgi:hypothetical protein